ncbi:glycosyltransferase family 2 protein [Mycoplasma sp. P36-A1]|uniref:glycosyltransferase family 2 protein n=1 Tax=Mycoplasma sp. P36-A1 TaxID=3252900 RepID=UPI003C2F1283
MIEIAILIPCYNEELTIKKVIDDFTLALPQAIVYVYDNNSTDNTALIAKQSGAIVVKEVKQGKGNVIRSMFRDIDAKCYLMIDGDDTYPSEYANEMVYSILTKKNDIVIGDRLSTTYFSENKRAFHNLGNKIVRKTINFLFNSDIKDIMTGYRAFSYRYVKSFPVITHGFEIETEMSIHTLDKNLYIDNIEVDYRDRPLGSESKLNTYSDGIKVIMTIFKLFKNYRPLAFFSIIAAILFTISLAFIVPVIIEYFDTKLVLRFPTLMFGLVILLLSFLMFTNGLLLDNVAAKDKRDFEMRLIDIQHRLIDDKYEDN